MKAQNLNSNVNIKHRTFNVDQVNNHLQEISRIGLTMRMLNPNGRLTSTYKQQQSTSIAHKYNNELSLVFLESLHMDLTPYQTLKQLIVQNKQLAKQSQSAYFLSKQSQKLINFIDGWTKLSQNNYNEEDFFINQEGQKQNRKISNHKRQVSANQLSQTMYKQQEREKMRLRLKQQQKVRKQGQEQLKRIQLEKQKKRAESRISKQRINQGQQQTITSVNEFQTYKKKHYQKLSTKPALIVEEQQSLSSQMVQQQHNSVQQQQEIEQIQMQSEQCDENNINNSNLIVNHNNQNDQRVVKKDNNKKEKKKLSIGDNNNGNKVIKLYTNNNKPYNQSINKQFSSADNVHQHLNQITRPEYQKTQISLSSSDSSLTQSRQTYQHNLNQNMPPIKKKKTIPLLKKNKQPTISYHHDSGITYNEVVAKKSNVQEVVDSEEISIRKVEEEIMREKGFVSEDTDANSRLTIITNKGKMIVNDQQRSLSPKVEGRKKVVVKLSSSFSNVNIKSNIPKRQIDKNRNEIQSVIVGNNGGNQQIVNSVQQGNIKRMILKKSTPQQQNESNKLQRELKELEDQFMNRNIRKSLQDQSNPHDNEQASNHYKQKEELNRINYNEQSQEQQFEQQFTQSLINNNRQNKTLQFIKKNQKTNQAIAFTNNTLSNPQIINRQLNSIVVEEEPWQCDQLQLEQQLKAIDQKILQRKSILSNQLSQYNTNNSNFINQTDNHCNFNSNTNDHILTTNHHRNQKQHKRSNTTNSQYYQPSAHFNDQYQTTQHKHQQNIYSQHLFQQHQHQQFQPLQQQPQYPQINHQPKVVRLSLNALAHNLNKKSRQSNQNHTYHQPSNTYKIHLQKQHNKHPIPYSHQLHKNASQSKLHHQPSLSKLQKQPSCKSIFLFQQAQKRGISRSKSNKSLKNNNRNVSPIKQYTQKDMFQGNQIPRTPRNIKGKQFIQRRSMNHQVLNTYESQSVPYLGNHSPSPIDRKNRSRTPQNKSSQRMNNFSPIQRNNPLSQVNNKNNKLIQLKYQQQPSSHSRTLSDMIESEYSRAKRMGYGEKENYKLDEQHKTGRHIYNDQWNNGGQYLLRENDSNNNKDHSMFSNCERYCYKNEEQSQTSFYTEDYGKLVTNKWGVVNNKNENQKKASSPGKKKRMVLLSDQLGG